MKKLLLLPTLLLGLLTLAQPLRPIAAEVHRLHQTQSFPEYALLSPNESIPGKYAQTLQKYTSLTLDQSVLNAIGTNKPQTLRLAIPFDGQILHVDLYRRDILTSDFKVQTQDGYYNGYQKGLYYRGIIAGDNTSLVAISIFKNQMIGIVSSLVYGDINVGKLNSAGNTNQYIAYSANDLLVDVSAKCGMTSTEPNANPVSSLTGPAVTTKKVRLYYELDYQAYADQNLNMTQTLDWTTAVHNAVSATYFNDGISNMFSSEVFVWTVPGQQYDFGFCCNDLYSFAKRRPAFNGDLATLVHGSGGANGYAMGIGITCINTHGGYSYGGNGSYNISGAEPIVEDFPVFSNTIKIITHETGHLLGSEHTHACVWNGNNTQIDDCGNLSFVENAPCYDPENPIIPENFNGTIMSYCCCTSMAIGFGPQPRQVIINTIENAPCFGTDGMDSCTPSIAKLSITEVGQTSAKLTIVDINPNANEWLFRFLPNEFQTITTNPMVLEGLTPKQIYSIEVKQICDDPFTANYIFAGNIYTAGVYCDEVIYDYTSEQYQGDWGYETSYFPADANDKVRVNFYQVRLDEDGETLYIHNGPTVSDPVIATFTGTSIDPPPITSSHATGALTFELITDDDFYNMGWDGMITCSQFLSATDFEKTTTRFYPNPVSDQLHFESDSTIKSIKITDVLGRKIADYTFNSKSGTIDLSRCQSGHYFAIVDHGEKKEVVKIVKD